ncbi:PilW family protein [Luteimonas sp. Y-2-2-4F]|nr:PilW family protein [Luteimonas sp. Y-2-2-4F]MCD9030690.1 PilW family protein [Luteimonas sp. Y-2-2-4F]
MSVRSAQRGFTLIELMVALVVGLLLVLGLIEVFSASRAAYQLSTGLARTQENGRFALDMLQRDLRAGGHFGCVNDQARFLPGNVTPSRPALVSTFLTDEHQFTGQYQHVADEALRFDIPVQGHNAAGTSPGETLQIGDTPTVATSGGQWAPAISATLFARLLQPVAGSDILVLRHFSPAGAHVAGVTLGEPAVVAFNTSHAERLTEGVGTPTIFGIADCMTAAVFGATADLTSGTLTVPVGGGNLRSLTEQPFVDGQATLHRADSVVYYVGLNAQGNPALYRLRHTLVGGAVAFDNEELVEGIESLQVLFGQDSNVDALTRPTGNIGSSAHAGALIGGGDENAWRRVGMIQVGVVARSPERAAAEQRDTGVAPPLSLLGLTVTPSDDGYYRASYEDAIALRNRLFGN